MPRFPHYKQSDLKDCGPTCLKIVSKYYGKNVDIQTLRDFSETNREGSSVFGLRNAAEKIGLQTEAVKLAFPILKKIPLPCILHWNKDHFVVLYRIKKDKIFISDPAIGILKYSPDEFIKLWIGDDYCEKTQNGIAIIITPGPLFHSKNDSSANKEIFDFRFISKYLLKYKIYIFQLFLGLVAASILQFMVPFLTQSIVDVGIRYRDLDFIYLVLIAQLFLFLGRISIEVIRGWILLHLSTRINISLISDFFIKLMKLPISFFDSKMTGDLLQRINDHKRIEKILTTSSLGVLFSMVNLFVFGIVLAYYNYLIFLIFLSGTILYFVWVLFFFKKRKILDYKMFSQISNEQSKIIELVNGMQEIKLHNAERNMRWGWERIQAKLFRIEIKNLSLEQFQSVGSSFINELKNILITILSAVLVIDGNLTLGMMVSITYIVGQLNAPILQIIEFLKDVQDAKIALERLGEIHNKDDEEMSSDNLITDLVDNRDIKLDNVSFRYLGGINNALNNITLTIPANKITAIVGTSGSGKTTLMKLICRFYKPDSGKIYYDSQDIQNISQETWREYFGAVMQDGYIFNDTIAKNVAIGLDEFNNEELWKALKLSNIHQFMSELPQGINTKIGLEGAGLSTGQKQRLLIARAIFKNPKILFFDEATSALDSENERIIIENLDKFFKDRTVLIIAHRLSTVKNAHQIIVMENGKIVEIGNHKNLTKKRGEYFNLVKNQLDLGG